MCDLIHGGWRRRRRRADVSSGSGQYADGGSIPWPRTQKRRADCLEVGVFSSVWTPAVVVGAGHVS